MPDAPQATLSERAARAKEVRTQARDIFQHALSEATVATPMRRLPPLGLEPGIADLVLADAISAAEAAGYVLSDSNLLVVGHGSKFGPASANATRKVAEVGVDGIVLSNHGGRQLDRAPVPFYLLPEVAREVGSEYEILLDTGIMSGADVVAAIALGARFTLLIHPNLPHCPTSPPEH